MHGGMNAVAAGIAMLMLCMVSSTAATAQVPLSYAHIPDPVERCDYCLAAQGISPLEVGSSGVRADIRYLTLGTMYQDGRKTENKDDELETHFTQQYSFYFSVTPELSASAIVPIAKRHSEQLDESGNLVTGNQFGLADASLLVRYEALVKHDVEATSILSFAAGIKFPTGRTNGKDSEGNLLDAHIQLGTGSTDALLGVSGFLTFDRVALIADMLGAITTRGAHGHKFGDILNYDASIRYRIYPAEYADSQLFATLGLYGELRGRERQDGIPIPSSGGNVLFLSPGLQFFLTPSITLEASYHLPVLHALNGSQLGEDYRIMAGVQFIMS
jgi:hypothetical protein